MDRLISAYNTAIEKGIPIERITDAIEKLLIDKDRNEDPFYKLVLKDCREMFEVIELENITRKHRYIIYFPHIKTYIDTKNGKSFECMITRINLICRIHSVEKFHVVKNILNELPKVKSTTYSTFLVDNMAVSELIDTKDKSFILNEPPTFYMTRNEYYYFYKDAGGKLTRNNFYKSVEQLGWKRIDKKGIVRKIWGNEC